MQVIFVTVMSAAAIGPGLIKRVMTNGRALLLANFAGIDLLQADTA